MSEEATGATANHEGGRNFLRYTYEVAVLYIWEFYTRKLPNLNCALPASQLLDEMKICTRVLSRHAAHVRALDAEVEHNADGVSSTLKDIFTAGLGGWGGLSCIDDMLTQICHHVGNNPIVAFALAECQAVRDAVGPLHFPKIRHWARTLICVQLGNDPPSPSLEDVVADNLALRAELQGLKRGRGGLDIDASFLRLKNHRVTKPDQERKDLLNMRTAMHGVRCNIPLKRLRQSMFGAISLADQVMPGSVYIHIFEGMGDRVTLTHAALTLADALDEFQASAIDTGRRRDGACGMQKFLGIGIETDESQPFHNRWTGYRFQITIATSVFSVPVGEWADEVWNDKPPIVRKPLLCDICHAPTKDGRGLMTILEKQLSRVRCTAVDVLSTVSDGGGENVGREGIHQLFDELGMGYVRKRGLEHISWRVCDAGLNESGRVAEDVRALCRYLHDGITWTRLQSIATIDVANGGLALMTATSRDFASVFTKAPPNVVPDRPETDMLFLEWLTPRADVLLKCIEKDSEQRALVAMDGAVRFLRSDDCRVKMVVLAELLRRGLLLHRFSMSHGSIMDPSARTTPAKLVKDATDAITNAQPSAELLQCLGSTLAAHLVDGYGQEPWWQAAARMLKVPDCLEVAAEFHLRVSTRMASHLALTFDNFDMSQWSAASLLSTNAATAQEGASALHDHLKRKPLASLTSFEQCIRCDEVLWAELGNFAERTPPVVLWRGDGAYRKLFEYMAPRFLACQDSVLGAEGIHSRWQHLVRTKHNVQHPLLSALLKLGYAEREGGGMPAMEDLLPHYQERRYFYWKEYGQMKVAGVAPKLRKKAMQLERFNIHPNDAALLRGPAAPAAAQDATANARWGNYCKWILVPKMFYRFESLKELFFYVAENKTLAGRVGHRDDDDAVGRSLSIVWFEREEAARAFGVTLIRTTG